MYTNEGFSMCSLVSTYTIANERWNSLSDKEKEVVTQVGEAATKHACDLVDELDSADKEKVAEAGVTYVTRGEDDLVKLDKAAAETSEKRADDLDKRNSKE